MMHALGFLHEQSRPDRDEFIRVVAKNVGENSQFRKMPQKVWEETPDQYGGQFEINSGLDINS